MRSVATAAGVPKDKPHPMPGETAGGTGPSREACRCAFETDQISLSHPAAGAFWAQRPKSLRWLGGQFCDGCLPYRPAIFSPAAQTVKQEQALAACQG